jgi:Ca-activated chloride channel homolog
MRNLPMSLLFFAMIALAGVPVLRAESLASKNKKGNQLYVEGKYADAEKEYLDAQVNNPGNSTILYNLGNSLIRQKKYDQAIQALNQAIGKGDKTAQENGWYNTGNALFAMEKYKDSADAFIQALKLNPSDRDAKHNLELALMKLKEQKEQKEQKQQQNSDSEKRDKNSGKDQNPSGQKDRQQPQKQDSENAGQNQNRQNEPAKQETAQSPRRENTVDKNRALQILDAVQNQELDEQRKLLERRARQKAGGKDW